MHKIILIYICNLFQNSISSTRADVTFYHIIFNTNILKLGPFHITLIQYSYYTHVTHTTFSLLIHFAPSTFALHSHPSPISVLLSTRCHNLIDLSKYYSTLSLSSLFYLIFILKIMELYYFKPFHIYP